MLGVIQYLSAILLWPIFKTFTDFQVSGKKNLADLSGPLIVTPNHECHLDPLLVGVGLMSRSAVFPLRFMAKASLFSIPLLNALIWIFGSYPVKKGQELRKTLEPSLEILKAQGTIMIFPEGKIISERGQLGIGKRGAAGLGILSRAKILPVSVHTPAGLTVARFFLAPRSSKKIRVNIGRAYQLNSVEYPEFSDATINRATAEVMRRIDRLYRKHRYDPSDLLVKKEEAKVVDGAITKQLE